MTAPTNPDGYGRTLVRGLAWTGSLRWLGQLAGWASTLIAVRILSPQDYGLVGMSGVFVQLAAIFADAGIGGSVVARRIDDRRVLGELQGASWILAAIVILIALVLAVPVSRALGNAQMVPVLMCMSLAPFFEAIRGVPVATLSRDLRFADTAKVDLTKQLVTAATVVGAALAGWGYWALVVGPVAGTMAAYALGRHFAPIALRWPRRSTVEAPLRYASQMLGGQLAWFCFLNSPFLIVGRTVGAAAFGLMMLSWIVCLQPIEKLVNVVTPLAAPFFAKVRDDATQLRRYFLLFSEGLALTVCVPLAGLAVTADLAVPLLLGDRWASAVPLVRVLICFAIPYGATTFLTHLLSSTGRARVMLITNVSSLLVMAPATWWAATRWGTVGAAAAWAALYPCIAWYPVRHALHVTGTPLRSYLAAWSRVIGVSVCMMLAVVTVRFALATRASDGIVLLASILTGVVTVAALAYRSASPLAVATRPWLRDRLARTRLAPIVRSAP